MAGNSDKSPASARTSRSPQQFLLLVILGATCAIFWIVPSPKEIGVAGRYSYVQLICSLTITVASLGVAIVCCLPKRLRRPMGFRFVAVSLAVGTALVCWEAGARFLPYEFLRQNPWYLSSGQGLAPASDLPFTRPPYIHWEGSSRGDLAMRPGDVDPFARTIVFQTDFEGFRNSRDIRQAEIIFLGDSFTEAGNVPEQDSFVQLIGQMQSMSVRNLGRAGYAPPSELIVLQNYGLSSQPSTVVWQLCEVNDLGESVMYDRWVQTGRRPFTVNGPTRSEAWEQRSPTYRLFEAMLPERPWPFGGSFRSADGHDYPIRFLPAVPGAEQSPPGHPGWPIMEKALLDGAEILKQRGIDLIVVLIPMKLRVMAAYVDFDPLEILIQGEPTTILHQLPADWDLPSDTTMAFHVAKLCDHLDVPFVDALPIFQQAAGENQMPYLPMDTHLSPNGHRLLAESIEATIHQMTRVNE